MVSYYYPKRKLKSISYILSKKKTKMYNQTIFKTHIFAFVNYNIQSDPADAHLKNNSFTNELLSMYDMTLVQLDKNPYNPQLFIDAIQQDHVNKEVEDSGPVFSDAVHRLLNNGSDNDIITAKSLYLTFMQEAAVKDWLIAKELYKFWLPALSKY